MNAIPSPEPRRVAIAPFDCLARAGRLIREDYLLFVGITFVGWLIAELVPFKLLAAPMYAGMFMAFKSREQGLRATFDQLFSRFDTFVPGLIATLVLMAVVFVAFLPVYGVAIGAMIGGAAAFDERLELLGIALFCLAGLAYLFMFVLAVVATTLFMFTYAILTEHQLDGLAALRLSARAALTNAWGALGLALVILLGTLIGSLCCLPLVFMLPFLVGAQWVAYRKVFGEAPPAASAVVQPGAGWSAGA